MAIRECKIIKNITYNKYYDIKSKDIAVDNPSHL